MQATVVVLEVDGRLQLETREFEQTALGLVPKTTCRCQGEPAGMRSGSGLHMTWRNHAPECSEGKVSAATAMLDRRCPCGCHEKHKGHYGEIVFFKKLLGSFIEDCGPADIPFVQTEVDAWLAPRCVLL